MKGRLFNGGNNERYDLKINKGIKLCECTHLPEMQSQCDIIEKQRN